MNAGQRKVGQEEPVGGVQVWRAEPRAWRDLVMLAPVSGPGLLAAGTEREGMYGCNF